jgi:hypothetical protein
MRSRNLWRRYYLLGSGVVIQIWAKAQTADGNQGLSQANTLVRSYYDTATSLMFAIGAIMGIIGAIRVFSMWIQGDDRMGKTAALWFGACIFLVVVATVIKSFFGI